MVQGGRAPPRGLRPPELSSFGEVDNPQSVVREPSICRSGALNLSSEALNLSFGSPQSVVLGRPEALQRNSLRRAPKHSMPFKETKEQRG